MLEKILFYFLIFSLPLQLRKILWPAGPLFNEWETIFLYGTDILIGLLLILWVLRAGLKQIKLNRTFGLPLFCLLIITLLSLFGAANFKVGIYQWLKLLEFILLFFYLQQNFKISYSLKRIFQVLVISGVFQSIIAVLQFSRQASLGLRLFGESPLSPNLTGAAKFVAGGTKFIRGYGTFPHPNILAGFLVLTIFALMYLFRLRRTSQRLGTFTVHCSLLALLLLGLFLTFSRVIIVIGVLGILLYLLFVAKNRGLAFLFIGLCLLITTLLWPMLSVRFSTDLLGSQAFSLRVFYNKAALQMFKSSSLIGIGWGNFTHYSLLTTHYLEPWLYQPVHNIYLLINSQAGLLGLCAFLWFLFSIIKRSKISLLLFVLIFFLIIGLFDHFLLTSQQGQLMLWLVLGVMKGYYK